MSCRVCVKGAELTKKRTEPSAAKGTDDDEEAGGQTTNTRIHLHQQYI